MPASLRALGVAWEEALGLAWEEACGRQGTTLLFYVSLAESLVLRVVRVEENFRAVAPFEPLRCLSRCAAQRRAGK